MMRRYFVYMVLCRDKTLYSGVTNDVDRRVAEHNYGIDPGCFTFTRRPVRLMWSSDFKDIDDAIRFEKQLKGWSRKKKRALILGDWDAIKRISREFRPRTK
jgi:putative endonuclease